MTLTILIVNWNSKEHLRRCLLSIRETCADISSQIIVVDNASFDGCAEMLAAEFPEVEFVQSEENLGFGQANNLGFQRARGECLLLLNPDTELRAGAVTELVETLKSVPDTGIAGPRLLNSDGSIQTCCVRALPTPLNRALDAELLRRLFPSARLWGSYDAFRARGPTEVECLSGACMLLKTAVFRQVGGFSPEFFMYGEDVDLCFKVRQLGLKLYFAPNANVVHHGGKSTANQYRKFPVVVMQEADLRVIRKWRGPRAAACYRLLQGLSALTRLPLLVCWTLARPRRGWWQAGGASVLKWWAVLRWSAGLEKWAAELHETASARRSRNSKGAIQVAVARAEE